jgi:hypothetical protein
VSRGLGANIAGCEIWSTNSMPVDNSMEAEVAQRVGFVKKYNYVGNGQGTTVRIRREAIPVFARDRQAFRIAKTAMRLPLISFRTRSPPTPITARYSHTSEVEKWQRHRLPLRPRARFGRHQTI